jgi:predicted CXXCH cytochrome family protein
MKHITRAVGVLIAVVLVVFVLPRLIPQSAVASLQQYGFYKGKDNSQEQQQVPAKYADPVTCNTCHYNNYTTLINSVHKPMSCENCHGPGQSHEDQGTPIVINMSAELCKQCHTAITGRAATFPQIDVTTHGRGQDCVTCHNPHNPIIPTLPHQVEGYNDCRLCHTSGGIAPFPASHEGRPSTVCLNCHQS